MELGMRAPWREIRRNKMPALQACSFYHTMLLPDGQEMRGMWDLRPAVDAYLGHVDFRGRSVLEVGPASGYLSFHMESQGAQVTCVEPPMERLWDAVPLAGFDMQGWRREFSAAIEGVRNSFWYAHHALDSKVRVFETDAERLSPDLGSFDVGVFAAVLLHCKSPMSILQGCAPSVRNTIVVTELYDATLGDQPVCKLLPRSDIRQVDTWWALTPAFVVQALSVLGFDGARVFVHHQKREFDGAAVPMFTVVAERSTAR